MGGLFDVGGTNAFKCRKGETQVFIVIVLENVHKTYRTPIGEKPVLSDISQAFHPGRNTGILGVSGSGKSTLMRLIAGIDSPTRGKIKRAVRVSWPLSYAGGFHPQLSAEENIKFAARIYGEDPNQTAGFVEHFAGLEGQMRVRLANLPPALKSKFSVGLGLAIRFDVYLVDELFIRGSRLEKQLFESTVERRLRESDVIVASQKPETILKFCQDALVLHHGRLFRFPHLTSATETYRQLTNAALVE
jgi:capsular polysaccharide transport system ATP-binding protein